MSVSSLSEEPIDGLSEVISEIPNWSDRDDVKLLYSMFNLKPIGLNKHFYMCEIVNNMNELQKSEGLPLVTPDTLWIRLRELYNLDLLEEYNSLQPQHILEEEDFDDTIEALNRCNEDSDEDKPLVKKLKRSESEESKISAIELETEEVISAKPVKNSKKKSLKTEENFSGEDEPATKSLRSRGSGISQKSKSPVIKKKK